MKKIIFIIFIIASFIATPCWGNDKIDSKASVKNNTKHLAYSKSEDCVSGKAYFDTLTGHKYIKRCEKTYAEYTKKGEFLKIVTSDQPLLNKSRNIHPITPDTYILYEKCSDGKVSYLSLPGLDAHPKGWKADKFLLSLN